MSSKKYKFDPELWLFSKMNVPIIPVLLPVMQKVLRLLTLGEHSDRKVRVRHGRIPSWDGKKLRTTIYTSREFQRNGPCVLVFHGGGFVYPASLHHYVLARKLAKELKAKAILVDYRLAPGHHFPVPLEDACSAYQWILENSDSLGIDREKIAVCGDSAGGNLAATVCLWARDNRLTGPCGQVLIYPFLDGRLRTRSMQKFTDTPMCSTRAMKKYLQLYLPSGHQKYSLCEIPREYFSPAEAASFEGLPPALIEVAQYDCLRDEGIHYARRLERAGVAAQVYRVRGAMHGYDIATGTRLMKRCMENRIAFLKNVFEEETTCR